MFVAGSGHSRRGVLVAGFGDAAWNYRRALAEAGARRPIIAAKIGKTTRLGVLTKDRFATAIT